jgi:hypothetical protein
MLIRAEGTRLLREKRGQMRPRRRAVCAEEAHGPPEESECLQRKLTGKIKKAKKSMVLIISKRTILLKLLAKRSYFC